MLLAEHPSIKPLLDYHFITEIELLSKPGITARETATIKGLLKICTKIRHTETINLVAISLLQQFRLKIPDALIAATSISSRMTLLTYDKDFSRIPGLSVLSPGK